MRWKVFQSSYSCSIGLKEVHVLVNSISEAQEKTLKRSFRDLISQEIITKATPAKHRVDLVCKSCRLG